MNDKTKRLTADDARAISGPTADEFRALIDSKISLAAKEHRELILRNDPYNYWLYEESKMPDLAREVVKGLRDDGYKVSLFYECRQFVDIGLKIEW